MKIQMNHHKTKTFRGAIDVISNLVEMVNLRFQPDGLIIQGMDSVKVCLVQLKLNKSWFEAYDTDGEEVLGTLISGKTGLGKILACHSENQTTTFESTNNDRFQVSFEGSDSGAFDKAFDVRCYIIDDEQLEVSGLDSDLDMDMNADVWTKLIDQLVLFGHKLHFQAFDDKMIIKSEADSSDTPSMTTTIKLTDVNEYAVTDATPNETFASTYLNKVVSSSKISRADKTVKIHIQERAPMQIVYDLSDSDTGHGELSFWIAPMMGEDEE